MEEKKKVIALTILQNPKHPLPFRSYINKVNSKAVYILHLGC